MTVEGVGGRPRVLPAGSARKLIMVVPADLERLRRLAALRVRNASPRPPGAAGEAEVLRDALRVGLEALPRLAQAVLTLRAQASEAAEGGDEAAAAQACTAAAGPLEELFLWLWEGRPSDASYEVQAPGDVQDRLRRARASAATTLATRAGRRAYVDAALRAAVAAWSVAAEP